MYPPHWHQSSFLIFPDSRQSRIHLRDQPKLRPGAESQPANHRFILPRRIQAFSRERVSGRQHLSRPHFAIVQLPDSVTIVDVLFYITQQLLSRITTNQQPTSNNDAQYNPLPPSPNFRPNNNNLFLSLPRLIPVYHPCKLTRRATFFGIGTRTCAVEFRSTTRTDRLFPLSDSWARSDLYLYPEGSARAETS